MMNKPQRKRIYKLAVSKWGMNAQSRQLMEECAELIQATNKFLNKESFTNVDSLVEELADVEIMIEQIKCNYDWWLLEEKVKECKNDKLMILQDRVKERDE